MINIYLVRHGQSEGNANHAIYDTVDDCDIRLTHEGIIQCMDSAKELYQKIFIDEQSVDGVYHYSSPYKRAANTCEIMRQEFNDRNKGHLVYEDFHYYETIYDPLLIELQFRTDKSTTLERSHIKKLYSENGFYFKFPDGESMFAAYQRARIFTEGLFRKHESESGLDIAIVIYSHGMFLETLKYSLLDKGINPDIIKHIST